MGLGEGVLGEGVLGSAGQFILSNYQSHTSCLSHSHQPELNGFRGREDPGPFYFHFRQHRRKHEDGKQMFFLTSFLKYLLSSMILSFRRCWSQSLSHSRSGESGWSKTIRLLLFWLSMIGKEDGGWWREFPHLPLPGYGGLNPSPYLDMYFYWWV